MSKSTLTLQVVGKNQLARQLSERFSSLLPGVLRQYSSSEGSIQIDQETNLILLVTRLDQIESFHKLLHQSRDIFFIGYWRSFVYVGPFWQRRQQGCPYCLIARIANSPFGPSLDNKLHVVPVTTSQHADAAFSNITCAVVGDLIATDVVAYLTNHMRRTRSGVFIFNTRNNELAFETLLPDSMCVICSEQTASTLPQFTESEHPLEKTRADTLHLVDAGSIIETLQQRYFSTHMGLVKEVQLDLQSPYGACSFEVPLKWKKKELAIGRSASYQKSKGIALLEAVERYVGWYRGGHHEKIRMSYKSVSEHALSPLSLGIHPEECYNLSDYPYKPFSPDLPINWVWGYSFLTNKPILIPERSAFYGYDPEQEPSFIYETSNGCALGSSTEEAIISGLLELVERDSFLMTWYRQLVLPELSTSDIADKEVQALLKKAELFTNCRFRVFLSTMEHGIPSIWVMAISNLADGPSIIVTAGAHLDLAQALKGALYELTGAILRTRHFYTERRENALLMLENPFLVREMEDHTMVNCLPEARERFAFLLSQQEVATSFETARARVQPDVRDLRKDLEFLVQQITRAGMDVIVVDQTMAEARAGGFVCVKVIIPGLLPMTFGHRNRRVQHLPRLFSDQILFLYQSCLDPGSDIGILPHPFP